MTKIIQDIEKKAKEYFREGDSHEFGHTERVLKNCLKIAKKEQNIDIEVLKAAALLHDIMRLKEDKKEITCHAEEGAREAEKLLNELDFPEEKIKKVVNAIKVHRLSKNLKAETKEGEILQDADRLDSLGAILIARSFSSAYIHNRPFYDLDETKDSVIKFIQRRAEKLKPETFNTQEGKNIAKRRYNFSEKFIKQLKKEI